MIFISIEWIYKNDSLTPAAKFFYFITLIMYLYFPILFLSIFAESKSSLDRLKSDSSILSNQDIYTIKFYFIHPIFILILSLVISWTEFNSFSYFVFMLISIIFTDVMAIFYAIKYYPKNKKYKNRIISLIFVFILLAFLGMYSHIRQPFLNIARWRFILKGVIYLGVFVIFFQQFISKNFKNRRKVRDTEKDFKVGVKELKNRKIGLIFSILLVIIYILLPFILIYALNTRYPLIALRTESMEPELQRGDLLFVIGIEPSDIKNGSIIVYDPRGLPRADSDLPIIHRVVDIKESGGKYCFNS